MESSELIKEKIVAINRALKEYLPPEGCYPEEIYQAMSYSLFAGGKRLRPLLCLETAEAVGMSYKKALPVACALEFMHTYSLIHDDLPAMDDDALRRGKPTNHLVFGEDMAILAGDALLTYVFEILSDFGSMQEIPSERIIMIIREIAISGGIRGMIGGQVMDLKSQDCQINKETLDLIHCNKTGALIRASVRCGVILAGAKEETLASLTLYAEKIGLAFQIVDDLLDEMGDEQILGKKPGSDRKLQKSTYVSILGQEASSQEAERLYREALECLQPLGEKAAVLRYLAKRLVYRKA